MNLKFATFSHARPMSGSAADEPVAPIPASLHWKSEGPVGANVPSMRIGSIVFRVDDLPRQLAFWTEALDYVPREPPEANWVVLQPRGGRGPNISLSVRPSQAQQGPRMHLDLYSEHQAGDIERLLALGATRPHEPNRPADADYVILADPEGNWFCVVDAN